jgi:prefoldin subunit 5
LEALDKRVDGLEKAGDGMRNTIKDVQDSISGLQRAVDKIGTHIDEELEELKNESATKWGGISVSLGLGFQPPNPVMSR